MNLSVEKPYSRRTQNFYGRCNQRLSAENKFEYGDSGREIKIERCHLSRVTNNAAPTHCKWKMKKKQPASEWTAHKT